MEIPVYLVAGFLDGGKTNFINGVLSDGFAHEDKTLLLCCEEGEEEYDTRVMGNVSVVCVDEEAQLTREFLKECQKKYRPRQVLIEYNGMWSIERLYREVLPKEWILYQIMVMIHAPTFEVYVKNMGQVMMEKILNADMIIFNRCDDAIKASLRARNLRMVNRRADIFLEDTSGNSEEYATDETPPFDLSQEVIEIADEDFGIWYVDAMDNPQRYGGKTVKMRLLMCHSKKYPGIHCPGRFAMVCCENDVQFLGVLCRGEGLEAYENKTWVEVVARVEAEEFEAYQGIGPVLYAQSVVRCKAPKEEVVTF
ncbi:MAG: hypothetical protein IJF15_04315 [Oscillospiraceae bacterium]|nr:hypothetical protein [Oscillospiraceae bacterium]